MTGTLSRTTHRFPDNAYGPRHGGVPLPAGIQALMESAYCADFSAVRIHVGSEASNIGALAFAHGDDLFFAEGCYNPHTAPGLRLLAHELAHVLQQRAGRIANPRGAGVVIMHDDDLEAEAELMSWAVSMGASHGPALMPTIGGAPRIGGKSRGANAGSVVQCAFVGTLADKTFEYFKAQAGMTFGEFNALKAAADQYGTLEAVNAALKVRRSAPPAPQAQPKVKEAPQRSIPDTWSKTFLSTITLYRADDWSPGKLKKAGCYGPKEDPANVSYLKVGTVPVHPVQAMLYDPRAFARDHINNNKPFLLSCGKEQTCAGYWNSRNYVYRFQIPSMYQFKAPPAGSEIMQQPEIYADTQSRTLSDATRVALDPHNKKQPEFDLFFRVPLEWIDAYLDRKSSAPDQWHMIDWSRIEKG